MASSSSSTSGGNGSAAPSAKEMEQLFQEAIDRSRQQRETSSGGSNLQMTPQEQANFFQAMQKPEFRDLLNDYMREISDPTHREETEKYLSQLEQEHKVPHDKILISPQPGFVVKTRFHKTATQKDQKLFINCCSHEQLQPPSSTRVRGTDAGSSGGTSWRLPYSLGPERLEADNSGTQVLTFDVCYHPRTLQFAQNSAAFQNMLINTSLDAVESVLRKNYNDQSIQLERAFHVLRGVRYKSGKPVTMCLGKQQVQQQAAQEQDFANTSPPKPTVAAAKTANPPKQVQKKTQGENTAPVKPTSTGTCANSGTTRPLIEEIETPVSSSEPAKPVLKTLSYQVIHRGKFEMTDHMQQTHKSVTTDTCRPKELVVRIPLPGHLSASGVELDVATNELKLQAKGYESLKLPLKFPVLEAKGHAKFDKTKQELVVTLPVQPPPPVAQQPSLPQVADQRHEHEQTDETEGKENQEEPKNEITSEKAELSPNEDTKPIQTATSTTRTERDNQADEFLPLREFAEMALHDPLRMKQLQMQTLAQEPEDVHDSPTVNNQHENDAVKDEYADMPELESATSDEEEDENDEESHEEHAVEDDHQQQQRQPQQQKEPDEQGAVQIPKFTITQSDKCLSLIIDQESIQESSVLLKVSGEQMKVQFSARSLESKSPEGSQPHRSFQLCKWFANPKAIDPDRREVHVASKNMVVILYKASGHHGIWPPNAIFQTERDIISTHVEPEQEEDHDMEQAQQELEKMSNELLAIEPPKHFRNELIYELD